MHYKYSITTCWPALCGPVACWWTTVQIISTASSSGAPNWLGYVTAERPRPLVEPCLLGHNLFRATRSAEDKIQHCKSHSLVLFDNPGLQIKLQLISCSWNQEVGALWRGRRCQLAVSVDRTGSQPHRSEEQYTASTHTAALLLSVHANMRAHCFLDNEKDLLWADLWGNPGHCSVLPGCQ